MGARASRRVYPSLQASSGIGARSFAAKPVTFNIRGPFGGVRRITCITRAAARVLTWAMGPVFHVDQSSLQQLQAPPS